MSKRVAYPFKRIDEAELAAKVSHDLKDTEKVVLNVTKNNQFSCIITIPQGRWDALWEKVGVTGGTLVVYWVSGGAGSLELLLRRIDEYDLPQEGEEGFSFSFKIPGHRHTEKGAVILRVISAEKRPADNLGAEQGGILWENRCPVEVRGSGGLMKVEYAAAPASKGLSAGPGEYRYSPDRGYELVVYTSHLPDHLPARDAAFHGAIAILLERALRHAYARLKEIEETKAPVQDNDGDGGELGILENMLDSDTHGLRSPRFLLEQEATHGDSRDTEYTLLNWCWSVAGSLAVRQTDDWCLSAGLITKAEEGK